jgi:hypothetical protein
MLHESKVLTLPAYRIRAGHCCFNLRVVDFNPSNCLLASNALLLFKSWLSIQTTETVIASNHGPQSPGYF